MASSARRAKLVLPGPGCWGACSAEALSRLSEACRDDFCYFRPLLVTALVGRLEGAHANICSALHALSVLAAPDSEHVIAALARLLEGPETWMKQHVMFAFVTLAQRGGAACIVAASESGMRHEDPDVRCSVLKILEQAARHGAPAASLSIVRALEDTNVDVRRTAVATLAELTGQHHAEHLQNVTEMVVNYLEHGNSGVRDTALAALTCIAVVANAAVVTAVAMRLEHHDPIIRRAAVQALQLISPGDEEKLQAVLPLLRDDDADVRRSALQALDGAVEGRQSQIVAEVLPLLDDPDSSVSHIAAQVLQQMPRTRGRRGNRSTLLGPRL